MDLLIYNNLRNRDEDKIGKCSKSLRFRRSLPSIISLENSTMVDISDRMNDSFFEYDNESSMCNSIDYFLEYLHEYYVSFIIIVGLIGNLLSSFVFLNTHLKMRSSSYYLAALAVTDFGYLMSLLCVWLNTHYGWRIFNGHGWCEILVYISAVCSSLSVWLIVAFTVERFIAVQYPLHRPQMCTVSRAKKIVITLIGLALICHSYAFFVAGLIKNRGDFEECGLKLQYSQLMEIINLIDTIASHVAPLIIIIVMNAMITRNLMKFGRRFEPTPSTITTTSNQCPSRNRSDINLNQIPNSSNSNNGIVLESRQMPSIHSSRSSKSSRSHRSSTEIAGTRTVMASLPVGQSSIQQHNVYQIPKFAARCIHIRASLRDLVSVRNQHSITKMLLLISTTFIILNLPSYVIRLWVFILTVTRDTLKKEKLTAVWCFQQLFMLLYYTNFSINFLLYAMSGMTFRRCLHQLLQKYFMTVTRCFGRRRRDSENS
ncbi:hypothetical protein PV327_006343 [Microctonus hyperodae]|uniref:G-protein coupled receptors family 1 profile domain-containing protein n=1 Tax=Microctonus hyperodae TaxID=165561 RepID=A0AA39F440_MICHY|nr:hypothetical protein PV327_006343 [Microctonus hyperodae]